MLENKCNKLIKEFPELYSDPSPEDTGPKYSMYRGGFETSDGWYDLLRNLSLKISKYIKENKIEDFEVHQVKSKFASLCYYTSIRDEGIDKMISEAEHEANKTCERCGSKENVKRRGGGWLVLWCDNCEKKVPRKEIGYN